MVLKENKKLIKILNKHSNIMMSKKQSNMKSYTTNSNDHSFDIMKYITRSILFFSIVLLAVGCSEDDPDPINPEIDTSENSDIQFDDNDVSFNLVNLKWSPVSGPNNEEVVYDIYLGDTKIKDSNKDTDYTLTNLKSDTEYSGRIVPKTVDSKIISSKNGKTNHKSAKESIELDPISFSVKTKQFADPNAPIPEISNISVNDIINNSATLNWDTATISDNSEITYNIYLEGDLIANSLTDNTYSFENLEPKTLYKGILLAISTNQKSIALNFEFTTLPDSDEVPLTSFTFFRGSATSHFASDWLQLIPIFSPVDANAVDLIWTSSDTNVAVVDESGYINTKNSGVTIITATFADNSNITQSIELTVTNRRPNEAKFISAQPKRSSLLIGDSKKIQVNKFNIEGGSSDDSFTFSSSDPTIASIDNEGNITGVTEGTIAITVTSTVDATITTSIMLRVVSTPIPVTGIKIWGETDRTVYFEPGIGKGGGITVEPEDATDKTLIWTSTNNNVVSVNRGSITTTGVGSASIIITSASNNEISETLNYTVIEDPTSYDETTGIYKAVANSKVTLQIYGFGSLAQGIDPNTVFIESAFSVKKKNGEEILEPWQQNEPTIIYVTDTTNGVASFNIETSRIEFIMPNDEEVTIEISLTIHDSANLFLSLPEFIIDNDSGVSKIVKLLDNQIILN